MNLKELLDRRIIFVSGKGGVGKTSVSALLALLAAAKQKKTLIIEMNSSGRVAPLFQVNNAGYEEVPLIPYVTSLNLSPRLCFQEYVLKLILFSRLYKAFFENKYVSNFLNAADKVNSCFFTHDNDSCMLAINVLKSLGERRPLN